MAKSEQGAKDGGENARSNEVKGCPYEVWDGVGSGGGGGRALRQGGRDLFCIQGGGSAKGRRMEEGTGSL